MDEQMKPIPRRTFLRLAAATGIALSLGGCSLLEPSRPEAGRCVATGSAPEIEFDYIVVNSEPISPLQREKYAEEHAEQIGVDEERSLSETFGANVVYANLLDVGEMVRHNPHRLAEVVLSCAAKGKIHHSSAPSSTPAS